MSNKTWVDDNGNEITEEYIIINKTAIQKRIEQLEKRSQLGLTDEEWNNERGQEEALKQILSQSIPLTPEIEKAFDEGQTKIQYEIIEKLGLKYQVVQVSQSTILNMEVHSEDYVSNLKLDI